MAASSSAKRHATTIRNIEQAKSQLLQAAMDRMKQEDWFNAFSANAQVWVEQVVLTGVTRFLRWLRNPDEPLEIASTGLGAVPTAAAHAVSLKQTLDLIRIAIDALEPVALTMAAPGDEEWLLYRMSYFGREVAYSAAVVYARVAEQQGARLARASTDLVDALLSNRSSATVEQHALRIGLNLSQPVRAAALLPAPETMQAMLGEVEQAARRLDRNIVTSVHSGAIVAVWVTHPREGNLTVTKQIFGSHSDAVTAGPATAIGIAGPTMREALASARARSARPSYHGVIDANELLAERAILGERAASDTLVQRCYLDLIESGSGLLQTVDAMADHSGVLEQAARAIPVHVNTLRYRLDRIAEITGFDLRTSRGAFAIFVGVSLGRARENTPLDQTEL